MTSPASRSYIQGSLPFHWLFSECSLRMGEAAELDPAGGHLVGPLAPVVAADVMAPPAVADVGRGGGELGLEIDRRPGDQGIA